MQNLRTTNGTAILADSHLISQTWRMRPEVQGDSYRSLTFAVTHCIQHQLSLQLGGDTLDSTSPSSDDVRVFREQMDRMEEAGLPVYAIQGNHDKTVPPWFLAIHPHVQHVHGSVYSPVKGLLMTAFDYMPANELREAVAQIPPTIHTVLLHQAARPIMDIPGAWNFDPAWLPEWVNTVFMGDIHMPAEFNWGPGTRGFYTGAGHVLALSEPWQTSMLDVRMNDGVMSVTRVPLPFRRYVRVSVRSDADMPAALHTIKTVGSTDEVPPVVVLEHAGVAGIQEAAAAAATARKAAVASQPVCHVWYVPVGGSRIEGAAPEEVNTDADVGAVLATCTADGEMHAFVMDLLTKTPTSDVIKNMRIKMGAGDGT